METTKSHCLEFYTVIYLPNFRSIVAASRKSQQEISDLAPVL